jgi:hypothetical protein
MNRKMERTPKHKMYLRIKSKGIPLVKERLVLKQEDLPQILIVCSQQVKKVPFELSLFN